jgi:hypothetical protein
MDDLSILPALGMALKVQKLKQDSRADGTQFNRQLLAGLSLEPQQFRKLIFPNQVSSERGPLSL